MNEKLEKLKKLRYLQMELEIADKYFNELIKEKEELGDTLKATPGLSEGEDILCSLQIIEYKMNDIAWRINEAAKHLKIYMLELGFNNELASEATKCENLSTEAQCRLIGEIARVFGLYVDTDLVRRHIISKNLKNILFSDILNAIIEV